MGKLDEFEAKFARMGARVKAEVVPAARMAQPVRVDVRRDGRGEYFDVRRRADVRVDVVDVRPADRHLLLLAAEPGDRAGAGDRKSKFLCGHDERAWFVAAVPERAGVRDVASAKDALKPAEVWAAIERLGVPRRDRDRRRTAAFVRQGEWFFVPEPWLRAKDALVLRNEPIRRGGGKPHVCQFLYRSGGEQVFVHRNYPNGLTAAERQALPAAARTMPGWRAMVRNAAVYVRGSVRHKDHKTVWLDGWHRVVMNTETQSRAMAHVAFLD